MKKRIEIYTLLSGVLFLISGIGKSLAVSDFANLITQYGFESLNFLAPVVVLGEILIGLFLIFHVQIKKTALVAIILLVVFTGIYLHGLLVNDIKNCGCFGAISILDLSPTFIFIRNGVLIYMLIDIFLHCQHVAFEKNAWIGIAMLACISIVSFFSGYTYDKPPKPKSVKKNEFLNEAVKNTILKEFVTTSPDSTYFVFAFSYSCPHCLNSIENLKQYESAGVVDKVIALALGEKEEEDFFRELFAPGFQLSNYQPETLFRLTNSFPTSYYIQNDTIKLVLSSSLPCSYLLSGKIRSLD